MLYPDEVEETQWRVIWFPPEKEHRTFSGSEAAVRRKASSENVADWNPIIERREVTIRMWEPDGG